MAIEDYMSCNELDNLQHTMDKTFLLSIQQHDRLQHDQLDSFSTNQASMLKCFLDKSRSRCDAHRMVS